MPLIDHPEGHYRFLPGLAPYSAGVVAAPGFEVVHATLHRPVPYRDGFDRVARHLDLERRPRSALCAVELRCPRPYSFDGFGEFNQDYAGLLDRWGLLLGEVNPVARTNVAPGVDPPAEPLLYGFSYTRPCADPAPTFVVAGGGELPEGQLSAAAIVWGGDEGAEGIAHKAAFVVDLMEGRLHGLGVDWPAVTAIDVYTVHPIHHLLPRVLLRSVGPAAVHGVRWFYSRPPVEGIEFEMDVRGVRSEIRIS